MSNVLIIDDDHLMNRTLSRIVERTGHDVSSAFTLSDGIDKVFSGNFDVVFLDVQMPDGNGLEVLPKILKAASEPEVIIITAFGNLNGAEIAINHGAWDYIKKSSSIDEMKLPLIRALQYRNEKKSKNIPLNLKRDNIIGNSSAIIDVLKKIYQASVSDVNVLITGETGTGKELAARAIHENSSRATNNFVIVDCASIPESLVESILFGHEKGAFTGADKSKVGLIEESDGGTLFLDEIGELPLTIQKSFLRVLQEHAYSPVGSNQRKESNFRVVAATNRNLNDMVINNNFRKDLLFRIDTFRIELPPLRECYKDVKDIILFHIKKLCSHYGVKHKKVSPGFFDACSKYDWPGNVRELVNTLNHSLAVANDESTLFQYHLPSKIRIHKAQSPFSLLNETESVQSAEVLEDTHDTDSFLSYKEFRENTDQEYFKKLSAFVNGKKNEACRISGLSRSRLYNIFKKYNI